MAGRSQRPRRLLMVINGLGTGGGESHMVYLAAGLAELGYEVTVVCLLDVRRDLRALVDAGVRILVLDALGPMAKIRRLPLLIRLARRADVVCSSLFDATLYGRIAAILAHRPGVTIEHTPGRELSRSRSGKSRARWAALHNRLLDPFTFAVIATAYWQVPILRDEGVSERKLRVIHNGVPVDELREAADVGVTRADLGIPETATLFVHVARFMPQKNQAATLEVVRRLREDLGDVRVLFAGVGELQPEVEAAAKAIGADEWSSFLGRRQDVPRLLRIADLFVLPSFAEAMPLSILEALSVGVPVVATDVADIRLILERTGAGLVVPRGDVDAYEQACRRVLTAPGLHERLSRAAVQGAHEHFGHRLMSRRYATILDAAADGGPVPTVD